MIKLSLCLLITFSSLNVVYAQGATPLNRVHGRVEADYLLSSELYRYVADVNVWFDIGQYKDAVFFFNGGILNYISHTSEKGFQPERYRGTLEPGVYVQKNRNTYYFDVKHQSFHDIDTFDGLNESYEIYTLAYKYSNKSNFYASVGRFENTQDVDYTWEFVASAELIGLGHTEKHPLYLLGYLRRVDESGNPTGRNGFTDYTVEFGMQSNPGLRYLTAYRHINDINRFNGVTDNEWVVGIRYIW